MLFVCYCLNHYSGELNCSIYVETLHLNKHESGLSKTTTTQIHSFLCVVYVFLRLGSWSKTYKKEHTEILLNTYLVIDGIITNSEVKS